MQRIWWKILAVLLLLYGVTAGFLMGVPRMVILHETIRNLYFHVPMWFTMIGLFTASVVYSVKHLRGYQEADDCYAAVTAHVGMLFGLLGLITGSIWAKYTWGTWWSNDPKQNSASIALLIYAAYFVLRSSIDEEQKRAKIGAVYNIFAFPVMIVLIFVLPRMTDSLHPGNGGNPGFNSYDLDARMRMVFYPICLGWILLGFWIAQLKFRLRMLYNKWLEL